MQSVYCFLHFMNTLSMLNWPMDTNASCLRMTPLVEWLSSMLHVSNTMWC